MMRKKHISKKVIIPLSSFILSSFILLFLPFSMFSPYNSGYCGTSYLNYENNAYYLINGSTIDGNQNNWTWAENQSWCSGNGTWANPYIIENLTLNCQGSKSGLIIVDSTKSFIIRSCLIYNSGGNYKAAGIYLSNVKNGKIIQNEIFQNTYGIYLIDSCKNMTIAQNIFINNSYSGLELDDYSQNITISENSFISNGDGMVLNSCSRNNVTKNTFLYNFNGIRITRGSNNEFNYNQIQYNNYGISFYNHATKNNLSYNIIQNNKISGIYMHYSYNNTFYENHINFNKYGVQFRYYSTNNVFNKNNLSNNGISVIRDSTSTGNVFQNCGSIAISIETSSNINKDDPSIFTLLIIIITVILIILITLLIHAIITNIRKSSTVQTKGISGKSTIIINPRIKKELSLCANCKTKLAFNAIFCHICGKSKSSINRFCAFCGEKKGKESTYCHKCGNKF